MGCLAPPKFYRTIDEECGSEILQNAPGPVSPRPRNLEHASQSILRHTDDNEQEARCWQMTLDFGRQYMQLYICWSQQCIEQIQKEENQ